MTHRIYPVLKSLIVTTLLLVLIGCVSSKTVLRDVRIEDQQADIPFKNILVVSRASSHKNRGVIEDGLAHTLKGKTTQTGVTYKDIVGINPIPREKLKKLAVDGNYDAVLGAFLVNFQHPSAYSDMTAIATPYGPRSMVTWTTADFVNIKLVLYDLESEKMVWSATSRTDRPESVRSTVKQMAAVASEELRRFGYIE